MVKVIWVDSWPDGAYRNARNNHKRIQIRRGLKYPMAVLAQEYYEACHKKSLVNRLRVRWSNKYKRRMEIMGHEIECQAAQKFYKRPLGPYRVHEAQGMLLGYGGLFKGRTRKQVYDAMRLKQDDARLWLGKNENWVRTASLSEFNS